MAAAQIGPPEMTKWLQKNNFGKFIATIIVDSAAEILQHLLPIATAYRKNKRKSKLFGVALIERLKLSVFIVCTLVQSRTGLFRSGLGRQDIAHAQFASKIRVCAQQPELEFRTCLLDYCGQGQAQTFRRIFGNRETSIPGLVDNPGGFLIDMTEHCDEILATHFTGLALVLQSITRHH